MGIYLAEQTLIFLQSLLVGAALGLLYDVFRISRVAFPTSTQVVFVEDILFFIVCSLVTFFFGLTVIEGTLRFFLIIGELLGAILYYFTLGKLVMGVSKKIIEAIKAILKFIFKWILRPIWQLVYNIISLIMRPFAFFGRKFKIKLQNTKFRLKNRRKVLYNQLRVYLQKKLSPKKPKKQQKANKRKERKNEKKSKTTK